MTKEMLVISALLMFAYVYWPVEKPTVERTLENTIVFHRGHVKAEFLQESSLDEVYMVFGMQTRPSMIANGYLGLIPIAQAKEIFASYPDMNQCGSLDSLVAQASIVNTWLIYDPNIPTLEAKAKEIWGMQHNKAYRICLRLKGRALTKHRLEREGQPFLFDDGGASYILLSDMEKVSCN